MYSEVKVNAKVSCHESACALDGLCVSRKKLKPTDHARNIVVISFKIQLRGMSSAFNV